MSPDNLVTSAKFIGSGTKQETSDTDSTKIGKTCKISLTQALNNLFKPLPMFCVDNNAPFRYS